MFGFLFQRLRNKLSHAQFDAGWVIRWEIAVRVNRGMVKSASVNFCYDVNLLLARADNSRSCTCTIPYIPGRKSPSCTQVVSPSFANKSSIL